ncbi:hypothetical protein QTP88_026302 [Uroleucon formosanum]
MGDERLSDLKVIAIEKEDSNKIDFDEAVDRFSKQKVKENEKILTITGKDTIYSSFCRNGVFANKNDCRLTLFTYYSSGCGPNAFGVDCTEMYVPTLILCDVYTGVCNKGCTTNYIAPDCEESKENILGSSNAISNKSKFQYLELKKLRQQKSIIEIIDDLKTGISYTFGVLLVSEEVNNNIDDIKTVNYSTVCLISRNINYDVNLLNGTYDKNDGKITEYLLKLMFNHTAATQMDIYLKTYYLVKNSSINSNISYGICQNKNIKAKLNQNSSLIIRWDVFEKYANMSLIYVIKYKVNKHFSCSNEVITNDWTSLLVFNQIRREIWDMIPNTRYVAKIDPEIKGYTYNDYVNFVFEKTPIATPKLTSIINDEDYSYISNKSAYFNWTINKADCSKLNGFFRGYQIILKTFTAPSSSPTTSSSSHEFMQYNYEEDITN